MVMLKGRDGDHFLIEMPRGDALDVCRMLELSQKVDECILDTPFEDIARIKEHFQLQVGLAGQDSNTTVSLVKKDVRSLSQVLGGVNVVDTDDFFGGDEGIPDDDTMQKLADSADEVYWQVCALEKGVQ